VEQERFEVSPLRPSWVVLMVFLYISFISDYGDALGNPGGWKVMLIIIFSPIIISKPLRLFVRLITFRPAVLLTEDFIYIAENRDEILWADITDVYLASNVTSYNPEFTDRSAFYIIIKVKDQEKYFMRIKNPILRQYRRWTSKLSPSPFEIKLSWVRGDEDELYQIVRSYFRNTREK
jgi:hypothetical protein